MTAKVFISHSHRDRAVATDLQSVLEKYGAETYLDQDRIQVADVLPDRIRQGIEWCNAFLLLWSYSADDSEWVGREWSTACQLHRKVIPYCLDSTSLPPCLKNLVYVDHNKDTSIANAGLLRAVFGESFAPPSTDVFPGHWRVTLDAFGFGTATHDLNLRANGQITGATQVDPGGALDGMLRMLGISDVFHRGFSVSGTWIYEDHTEILTLDMIAHGFGQESREKIQMRVTRRETDTIQAQDFSGRTYTLRRISAEKQYTETAELGPNTHVDRQHNFLISWPIDSEWVPSDKLSKSQLTELGLTDDHPQNAPTFFVFKFDTPSSPHAAGVFVHTYPSNLFNNDIQVFVDSYKKSLNNRNVNVISSEEDHVTGGFLIGTRDEKTGWIGISRLLVGTTYSYVVSTRIYPLDEEYEALRAASQMIFSSFKILN